MLWLMLPMFCSADEAQCLSELVNGRAEVVPLVETYDAARSIDGIVNVSGITEVYIGH